MQTFATTKPRSVTTLPVQNVSTRLPMLAIITTIAGTLLAVSFIPSDPEPQGALFTSALMLSIGLAAAPIIATLRDQKSILLGEHLLALAPIYWMLLDLLQGSYLMDTIQPEQINTAFTGIGLFVVAGWVGASLRQWRFPESIIKTVSVEFSANVYFLLATATFALGMLRFAVPCNFNVIEMISYLGENRWAAPWQRGQLGGWDAFLDHIQYFGYLIPIVTVIIARRTSWVNTRTVLSCLMSLTMVVFIAQSGSRRVVGVIFGMAFILWVLTEQRLRIKHTLIAAISLVAILVAMQLMLEYRTLGFTQLFEGEQKEQVFQRGYLHVDDNFYRFCQIIQFIPESYPYVYHKYIIWVLVRPIPRVFWPDKPVDPGFDLPTALGVEGISFSSTVIGELYMSAGLLGIALGGLLYGILASMANQLLTQRKTFGAVVIYSVMMMALFSGMRSMLELILVSYVVLAWIGLSRLIIGLGGYKAT
jgi:oligosaccharide repeat unit polymerase